MLVERDRVKITERAIQNLISSIEVESELSVCLPFVEGAGSTIASYRYIFANDFALLPFMVVGVHFGDIDVGRTLLVRYVVNACLFFGLALKELDVVHKIKLIIHTDSLY